MCHITGEGFYEALHAKTPKRPHLRLHVNLEDRKPLWWVNRPAFGRTRNTGGFSTSAAAIDAAKHL